MPHLNPGGVTNPHPGGLTMPHLDPGSMLNPPVSGSPFPDLTPGSLLNPPLSGSPPLDLVGAALGGVAGAIMAAKGRGNISNYYLDQLRRKNPKATKEQLCEMLREAYEAARKSGDSDLAATIKLAQKALGCRPTHYGK
jgi:hypothetical protein